MKKAVAKRIVFVLILALLLTACESGASAAAMRLRKTEGTVDVSDSEGKDLAPREDLGLYSGYQVGTQAESYAWIDLDNVKLAKMDADSRIEIAREGKELDINVKSGSLFFNVTEPLDDDETMDIRTSSLIVGIRGTCGWVEDNAAALLKGTVSVTAGEQTVTVRAGEMAVLTPEGTLEVTPLTADSVPAFVREEIADEEDLAAAVPDTADAGPTEPDPAGAYADALAKYGKEVVYTELVDFEGDGDPELLVIAKGDTEDGYYASSFDICAFRNGPEGVFRIPFVGISHLSADIKTDTEQYLAHDLSLVEYQGKMFLKYDYARISTEQWKQETTDYISFYMDGDGVRQIYQEMAECYTNPDGQKSYNGIFAETGGGKKPISAGEAEAISGKYTEVHDLITLAGNELVVVES